MGPTSGFAAARSIVSLAVSGVADQLDHSFRASSTRAGS